MLPPAGFGVLEELEPEPLVRPLFSLDPCMVGKSPGRSVQSGCGGGRAGARQGRERLSQVTTSAEATTGRRSKSKWPPCSPLPPPGRALAGPDRCTCLFLWLGPSHSVAASLLRSSMVAVRLAAGRLARRRWAAARGLCSSATRGRPAGNVLDTLASRSLLAQVTAPNSLQKHLEDQRSVYVGVDPSADSLHVGNLLPMMAALHFLQHGHRVVVVIGGATGSIGDPSGRSTERSALSASALARNVDRITEQVNGFFRQAGHYLLQQRSDKPAGSEAKETPMQAAAQAGTISDALVASEVAMSQAPGAPDFHSIAASKTLDVCVVNNEEWYRNMNVLAFLRDVGKLARVGTMLARDSVKARLQPSEGASSSQAPVGLSFTEFSYQLLQAYDFSVLHGAPWHCTVQLGGSDQMGNIVAGVDLIRRQKTLQERRLDGEEGNETPAYGLTLPLLTTATGAKFGKSAGNAVWLSQDRCSDFDFYQFFYRSRDDEVPLYLKTLTMLPLETIESIMRAHQEDPSSRSAQKVLAGQVTELVRGKQAVVRAQTATRILFETHLQGLKAEDVLDAFHGDPRLQPVQRSKWEGVELIQLAVDVGLTKSKGEARRAMASGGFYLNNAAIGDQKKTLVEGDTICQGQIAILRVGRTGHRILSLL